MQRRFGFLAVAERLERLGPHPAQRRARRARRQRLGRLGENTQRGGGLVVVHVHLVQRGGRDGGLGQRLQRGSDDLLVEVQCLLVIRGRRGLRALHGLDHVENLLVDPHDGQHGQGLVVVELVAFFDRLDPGVQSPLGEIETRTGDPVAITGQSAPFEQLAQRCRRLPEQALVVGTHRPHRAAEHLGPLGLLLEQGGQRRAAVGGSRLCHRRDLEPARGDPQPEDIAGLDAEPGQITGRQQQRALAAHRRRGHPARGKDLRVELRENVADRGAVGQAPIGVQLGHLTPASARRRP